MDYTLSENTHNFDRQFLVKSWSEVAHNYDSHLMVYILEMFWPSR